MIKFENVEVQNWMNAIRGIRNSWESWDKMDSSYINSMERNPDTLGVQQVKRFVMGENDYKLAMTLSKSGSGHDKFLRQIFISVDIIAPEYWWKETDTYHFFETNSTSMMHTLGREEIESDIFSFDNHDHPLVKKYMEVIQEAREQWIASGKKKPSPEWRLMNQLTAISFIYRRTFTSNYSQLKSMYHQRRNHRLQEWTDFRNWVDTLPYSELITLKVKEQ